MPDALGAERRDRPVRQRAPRPAVTARVSLATLDASMRSARMLASGHRMMQAFNPEDACMADDVEDETEDSAGTKPKAKPRRRTGATGKAKGGIARAAALAPERRRSIAVKAAAARWGEKPLKATHRGTFKEHFGIDVDCYVLDDEHKTAVITKRGMGAALKMGESGSVFSYFISGEKLVPYVGSELAEKLANPLIFQWVAAGASNPLQTPAHGYDATILIDVCKAIIKAADAGVLGKRHHHIVKQANVIQSASAKHGIKHLVYALAGYDATREEVIAAFKIYVQQEAREYEKAIPDRLYHEWYRLYDLPKPERNKPWKFKALTIDHIYKPLAKSNGRILELTRYQRAQNPKDRSKKLHQFLSKVGVTALGWHVGELVGMAKRALTRAEYERAVQAEFGIQLSWDF